MKRGSGVTREKEYRHTRRKERNAGEQPTHLREAGAEFINDGECPVVWLTSRHPRDDAARRKTTPCVAFVHQRASNHPAT